MGFSVGDRVWVTLPDDPDRRHSTEVLALKPGHVNVILIGGRTAWVSVVCVKKR